MDIEDDEPIDPLFHEVEQSAGLFEGACRNRKKENEMQDFTSFLKEDKAQIDGDKYDWDITCLQSMCSPSSVDAINVTTFRSYVEEGREMIELHWKVLSTDDYHWVTIPLDVVERSLVSDERLLLYFHITGYYKAAECAANVARRYFNRFKTLVKGGDE